MAYSALFAEHYGAVVRYAERRIADLEVAREVANDCFVVAWQKFDSREPFGRPWLYGTARNLIANEYRRRAKRSMEVSLDAVELPSVIHDHDDRIDIQRTLQRMTDAQREILLLAYWEQLLPAEIAAVMGISSGAARVRLMRARDRVRELLGNDQTPAPALQKGLADELG